MPTRTTATSSKPAKGRATSFEPMAAQAFGLAVRAIREERGVAQDAFALAARVDRSYYGKLERGQRQPTLGLMLRIAAAFDMPAAALVAQTEVVLKKLSRTQAAK